MKKNEYEMYLETIETQQLIDIILKLENYEAAGAALLELSGRDSKKMIELSKNILERELGDKYFQGLTFSFLYGKDQFIALSIISDKIDKLDVVILKDVMDEVNTDCYQPIAEKIDKQLLYGINKRYLSLSKENKNYISDEYKDFIKFYGEKFL